MERVYCTDLTGSSEEQIVFYINDMSPNAERVSSLDDLRRNRECCNSFGTSPGDIPFRTHSVSSQTDRPRRSRDSLDTDRLSRRSSIHSNRSRTNSYVRPTPLGDGRRASVCRRGKSRRPSTSRRKDSIRPTRQEVKLAQPIEAPKNPREIERARRHHRITMIILGTFLFLLITSVLAVVVTLTHSSFHSPPIGSKELAEHRALCNTSAVLLEFCSSEFCANVILLGSSKNFNLIAKASLLHQALVSLTLGHNSEAYNFPVRKENEELLNSLNRDTSVPINATASP